jgi:hypothetical protein
VQASPHRSRQTNSVWTLLCARGHCHSETGKVLPQTVATKLEVQNWSRMALYAVAFPSTGTKSPNPDHEKEPQIIIPPPPNFSWHCAFNHFAAEPLLLLDVSNSQ